jgi:hypothetical protein
VARGERRWTIIDAVNDREKRVAQNESTSREINEQLEEAHEGDSPGQYVRMVCECGRDECDRLIAITIPEYEQVRSDPRQFVVVKDHVIEDVERVLYDTDRFVVVGKLEGTPAKEVTEEDART